MGSQVPAQLRQQQLLIQVLSFCEEAKGRKRREGGRGGREGGREGKGEARPRGGGALSRGLPGSLAAAVVMSAMLAMAQGADRAGERRI